jgi:hypothetical protein
MKLAEEHLDQCVAALIADFPVEDVWLLEAGAANECALEKPLNLIVIVPDACEAHVVESAACKVIRTRPEWSKIDLYVFPMSAITRIPRPLLVKMALKSGRNIYCK